MPELGNNIPPDEIQIEQGKDPEQQRIRERVAALLITEVNKWIKDPTTHPLGGVLKIHDNLQELRKQAVSDDAHGVANLLTRWADEAMQGNFIDAMKYLKLLAHYRNTQVHSEEEINEAIELLRIIEAEKQ